jgi:hypothetical protein
MPDAVRLTNFPCRSSYLLFIIWSYNTISGPGVAQKLPRNKTTKKQAALTVIVAWIIALLFAAISLHNKDWAAFIWSTSTVIALPCWAIAVKAPTHCGVITIKGHPCPNRTTGILMGCGSARGHTWAKFFSWFGWRWRHVATQQEGSQAFQSPPPSGESPELPTLSEPIRVRVEEGFKDKAIFVCTASSTLTGLISAAVDMASVVGK